MKIIKKISTVVYSLYACAWFILLMLLIFPFTVIASFFGRIKGGNLIYSICRFWADCWFLAVGIHHNNIYEQHTSKHSQYIFISNHNSYFDIPVMMKAVRDQPIRILGKAETAMIPIFGFIYRNAVVMVDRENVAHRRKSAKDLKCVLAQNISIFICPEGTFNMSHQPLKKFYDGAFRIAIETHTPIKPILFLDSYERLSYNSLFSLTPGRSRAVYLSETVTAGLTLVDLPWLKEKIYHQMEDGLRRYKASWIRPFY